MKHYTLARLELRPADDGGLFFLEKNGPPFLALLYVVEGDQSAVSRWITVVHPPTTAGLFQARYQPVGQGGTYSYIMSEPRWFKSERDVHRWIKRIVAGYDKWYEEKGR